MTVGCANGGDAWIYFAFKPMLYQLPNLLLVPRAPSRFEIEMGRRDGVARARRRQYIQEKGMLHVAC